MSVLTYKHSAEGRLLQEGIGGLFDNRRWFGMNGFLKFGDGKPCPTLILYWDVTDSKEGELLRVKEMF